MQKCLRRRSEKKVEIYCLHSFKLKVLLDNEQQEKDYDSIIERFENDDKMKMYNVCYWLSGRKIKYEISFRYVMNKGIQWNLVRYRNYLRLKVRLKELQG